MNRLAEEMTRRIQRAIKSGKLKQDKTYTIPVLAAILGTTRTELSYAVNREFGSIKHFYSHTAFAGTK
jgi:DNA-binding GntR family transcriptional regulator